MRLVYLGLALITGIYLGSRVAVSLEPTVVLFLTLILPALAAALLLIPWLRRKRTLLLSGLGIIAFLFGILRFQATIPVVDEHALQFYNDQGSLIITGMIDDYPEPQDGATSFRLAVREVMVEGDWRAVSGSALVYAPKFPALEPSRDFPYYHYGDLLRMEARLETPPQLKDFDYREYLANKGIHSIVHYPPNIELIASGQGFEPLEWVYHLRSGMSQALALAFPEPQASLAQGLLLGLRSGIPEELSGNFEEGGAFEKTGTGHIIAISGLHIAIVAGIVLSIGAWVFGRQKPTYILIAVGAIWLYTILTGMRPSTFRAAIMGSLWLTSIHLGRQRSGVTWLVFAGALMAAIHPLILWDVAFQLGFAAIAGLALLTPHFQTLGRRIILWALGKKETGLVASIGNIGIDIISVTGAAIIFTLPLIAVYFHRISLVALPANLFLLPILPVTIMTSALVGGIGLFAPSVAQVVGWTAWLFLTYLISVVQLFAALPWSSVKVGEIGEPLVWGYYGLVAGILWIGTSRKRLATAIRRLRSVSNVTRRILTIGIVFTLILVATLVWVAALATPDNQLHVSFLDVGQGDAILIRTPSHQKILIDGGPSAEAILAQLGEQLPFWDRTIDLVILTHPHQDHVGGLVEVLRRYEVKQVLEPGLDHTSQTYMEWLKLLKLIAQKQIKPPLAQAGQRIELGEGITLEVLHPQAARLRGTTSDLDNNSVVLRLIAGEVSILLTGDIGEEAECLLLDQEVDLNSTILKVAHHGSKTSTSSKFLDAVNPEVAIICVGEGNRFEHPHPETLEKLAGVVIYRTDEHGTIEVITDGTSYRVEVHKSNIPQ